jgi:hypothetical protein
VALGFTLNGGVPIIWISQRIHEERLDRLGLIRTIAASARIVFAFRASSRHPLGEVRPALTASTTMRMAWITTGALSIMMLCPERASVMCTAPGTSAAIDLALRETALPTTRGSVIDYRPSGLFATSPFVPHIKR